MSQYDAGHSVKLWRYFGQEFEVMYKDDKWTDGGSMKTFDVDEIKKGFVLRNTTARQHINIGK